MPSLKKELPTVFRSNKSGGGQKGVSILFAVLIMTVILAIGLGLSAILIQQIRMMAEVGHSVNAFFAADWGVEEALYHLYRLPSPPAEYDGLHGQASFQARARCAARFIEYPEDCPLGSEYIDPDCDATNYCLKSLGVYQKTRRSLEIQF